LTSAQRNQRMWQVMGYTNDPGGYFDILLKTTATTSGAPVTYAEVSYTV
jgi:hypothetical protein